MMKRREFLSTGAAVAAALSLGIEVPKTAVAQRRQIKHSKATTTKLFKSPGMYPNGIAVAPEGLWIAQQKMSLQQLKEWGQPVPADRDEAAWLVDWNGKLLKTVNTHSRFSSGVAYGNKCVWMCANTDPFGVFRVDMNSKEISHQQIPLTMPGADGGGCHGAQWHDGKLWIVANRLRGNMRVDPETWKPEVMFPIYTTAEQLRWHDITFDQDGYMWQVSGNDSTTVSEGKPGLIKYDGQTGQVLELVEFEAGTCDPHGLEYHDGHLISCDAGYHPGWKDMESPSSGWIFRIDIV